jgi:thiol-disulfide isomerase/thioredoxin
MNANASCALVNNEHDLKEILKVEDKVIALFYASWCPFSQRFLPIFQKHVEKEGRHFVMVQNDQETMVDQYSVKVYPTVLFFEKGIILKRLDGVLGVGLDEKQFMKT